MVWFQQLLTEQKLLRAEPKLLWTGRSLLRFGEALLWAEQKQFEAGEFMHLCSDHRSMTQDIDNSQYCHTLHSNLTQTLQNPQHIVHFISRIANIKNIRRSILRHVTFH
jgi:hypothetical protein